MIKALMKIARKTYDISQPANGDDRSGRCCEKVVVVEGRALGAGEGPSRRVAETAAAVHALEALRRETAERGAGGSGLRPELAMADATATEEPAEPDDQPSQLTG